MKNNKLICMVLSWGLLWSLFSPVGFGEAGNNRLHTDKLVMTDLGGPVSAGEQLNDDGSEFRYGDVNGDGEIDVQDAILMLRHITGLENLPDDILPRAIVSGSDKLTVGDAILVLRYVTGLIDVFPVEEDQSAADIITAFSYDLITAQNLFGEKGDDIQAYLIPAAILYKDAMLAVDEVLTVDPQEISHAEWEVMVEKALQLLEVAEKSSALLYIAADQATAGQQSSLSKKSGSARYSEITYEDIDAIYTAGPHGERLKHLAEHLGVDARKANVLLKTAQAHIASGAWEDFKRTTYRLEVGATAIRDTCKVTLFVGATVMTGGASTGILKAAVVGATVVSGTDLVVEIAEDASALAFGDKDKRTMFLKDARSITQVPATIVGVVNLATSLKDPGNIMFVGENLIDFLFQEDSPGDKGATGIQITAKGIRGINIAEKYLDEYMGNYDSLQNLIENLLNEEVKGNFLESLGAVISLIKDIFAANDSEELLETDPLEMTAEEILQELIEDLSETEVDMDLFFEDFDEEIEAWFDQIIEAWGNYPEDGDPGLPADIVLPEDWQCALDIDYSMLTRVDTPDDRALHVWFVDENYLRQGLYVKYFDPEGGPRKVATYGCYQDGRKQGKWVYWNYNPYYKYMEETYHEDILHGPYKDWWYTGFLREQGQYTDGSKSGTWRYWHEDGSFWHEKNYSIPYTVETKTILPLLLNMDIINVGI